MADQAEVRVNLDVLTQLVTGNREKDETIIRLQAEIDSLKDSNSRKDERIQELERERAQSNAPRPGPPKRLRSSGPSDSQPQAVLVQYADSDTESQQALPGEQPTTALPTLNDASSQAVIDLTSTAQIEDFELPFRAVEKFVGGKPVFVNHESLPPEMGEALSNLSRHLHEKNRRGVDWVEFASRKDVKMSNPLLKTICDGRNTRWTKDGRKHFADHTACTRPRQPCFLSFPEFGGAWLLLPLHPELRGAATPSDMGYWVCQQDIKRRTINELFSSS